METKVNRDDCHAINLLFMTCLLRARNRAMPATMTTHCITSENARLSQPATGRKRPRYGEGSTVTGEGAHFGQDGEQERLS